jgi:hypothetical protein
MSVNAERTEYSEEQERMERFSTRDHNEKMTSEYIENLKVSEKQTVSLITKVENAL